jgi:hypothetical protein
MSDSRSPPPQGNPLSTGVKLTFSGVRLSALRRVPKQTPSPAPTHPVEASAPIQRKLFGRSTAEESDDEADGAEHGAEGNMEPPGREKPPREEPGREKPPREERPEGKAGDYKSYNSDKMLKALVGLRDNSSASIDDIEVFVNRMDLKDIAYDCYKQFASRPRAVGHFLPLLFKADPKVQAGSDDLQKLIKDPECGGKILADGFMKFVAQFLSYRPRDTHSFVGIAALISCAAAFRSSSQASMTTAFERSFRVLKYVRHYCAQEREELKEFFDLVKSGELKGLSESVIGSPGLDRTMTDNEDIDDDLVDFLTGLTDYVGFETVVRPTAAAALYLFMIVGPTHPMRMQQAEKALAYQARWERAYSVLTLQCSLNPAESWRLPPPEALVENLKKGCHDNLWDKVVPLLELDQQVWSLLSLEHAWDYLRHAQTNLDITVGNRADKNGPADKPFVRDGLTRKQRDRDDAKKALRPASSTGEQVTPKAVEASASPETGRSEPGLYRGVKLTELLPAHYAKVCSHVQNGRDCFAADDCPFTHPGRESQRRRLQELNRSALASLIKCLKQGSRA